MYLTRLEACLWSESRREAAVEIDVLRGRPQTVWRKCNARIESLGALGGRCRRFRNVITLLQPLPLKTTLIALILGLWRKGKENALASVKDRTTEGE